MADTNEGTTRRDFIHVASATAGALGVACVAWPFIDQMNPAADSLTLCHRSQKIKEGIWNRVWIKILD